MKASFPDYTNSIPFRVVRTEGTHVPGRMSIRKLGSNSNIKKEACSHSGGRVIIPCDKCYHNNPLSLGDISFSIVFYFLRFRQFSCTHIVYYISWIIFLYIILLCPSNILKVIKGGSLNPLNQKHRNCVQIIKEDYYLLRSKEQMKDYISLIRPSELLATQCSPCYLISL